MRRERGRAIVDGHAGRLTEERHVRPGAALADLRGDPPSVDAPRKRVRHFGSGLGRTDRDARAIYAADKIAKVRELRAKATQDPRVLNGRKLEHYRASLEMLRGCADGLALVDQLEFELWALDVLPPSQLDNGRFTDR